MTLLRRYVIKLSLVVLAVLWTAFGATAFAA